MIASSRLSWAWRFAAVVAFVPAWEIRRTPWQVVLAFWAMAAAGRALQIARAPGRFLFREQVLIYFLLVDPRPSARRGRATPWVQLPLGLSMFALALGLFYACSQTQLFAFRAIAGGLAIVCAASGLDRALRAVLSFFSLHYARFQDAPLWSQSPSEFWGRRWNRLVGAYLASECYLPVARRRGRTWGIGAAFGASALLHALPLALTVGTWGAAGMTVFFILHGVAVASEPWWKPTRASTLLFFAVTSPLFVFPLLAALGV